MFRGAPVLAFLFLLLTASLGATAAAKQPLAVQGRLQLDALPQQPLALQGEWAFAWNRFVDPAWTALPAQAFAPVPSSWNDVTADGKPPGENGSGTYLLQVNCPAGQSMAIEAVGQRTASRLFINGTLVAQHGEPGPTAAASWAAVHNRIPITREFACPLRLTLHVSNFDHRAGGFVRPIMAGPADALERARESRIVHATGLLSAYLLTGLVALIFFAVRRRERVPLVFGLFCLAMGLYTDLINERLFLRWLPPQVGWFGYMRAEYLSWVTAMGLFFMTLRGLFPQEITRRAVQVVVGVLALAAVAILVLPPAVYSYVAQPGQAIAVAVALYVAAAMIRASRHAPEDAGVLLAGMLAIVVTSAVDLLLIDAPGPDRKFGPVGFAFFLLSPAVVIARRLSHALNAEERARTLEENARLREDVERMSRHDLKTPLNSILGATRLLRDDAKLNTDQRELVGVLQRASMRMLEMVNLSLGLFRMETGTYDFRPQAVNLHDVITRVLLDLHSYAESNGTTVHLRGSGHTPVYVRAEELLCYSIIANVVKNAIEAAGPGGMVTLAIARDDPVQLSVHNAGEVPPAIAERFFEKYVTAGKSGGTGLGTYSARLMARTQRGELALRTSAAEGTTLLLTLPALRGAAPTPQPVLASVDRWAQWLQELPARDVLLVDDDEYTRLITRRLLPNPPFTVDTAANGQSASEAMMRRWPHHLIVDMEMPVQDGVTTVRWVRKYEAAHGLPRCGIVMVSGNDDDASAKHAREAGADRFLVKPVSREQLLAALHALETGGGDTESEARDSVYAALAAPAANGTADEDKILVVDPEWMAVFPGFLRAQRDTVEAMGRALAAGDREDVQFLAHRAFGGLASMGLDWASRHSRRIERNALQSPAEDLQRLIEQLREHLRRVRIEPA
ncbi:MAG TPA: response regulator [Ramlibacter sp.]|uniref:response regulator n=1 Tax=Ramlibacter sp. TaxID=1917967 RepID=UPI002ED1F7F2